MKYELPTISYHLSMITTTSPPRPKAERADVLALTYAQIPQNSNCWEKTIDGTGGREKGCGAHITSKQIEWGRKAIGH
jgi:hypothetical protein